MWEQDDNESTALVAAEHRELAEQPFAIQGVAKAPEGDGSMLSMMVQASQALDRQPAKLLDRAKTVGGLLGASGFYRFPTGGQKIEGPSIKLAQALAQEWGSIMYQVRIVYAEPLASGGQRVQLRASVADMKTLVCAEVDQVVTTSAPPGKFAAKPDQSERWHAMQLQNASSKIVRNAILRVLPAWFVQAGFDAAVAIDDKRALNGKSLPEARANAVAGLKKFGCSQEELEQFVGQPLEMWATPQLSQLRQLFFDLKDSAVSVEAWRQGLHDREQGRQDGPVSGTRNTLGIPSKGASAPVDMPAAQDEPAAAKSNKGSK